MPSEPINTPKGGTFTVRDCGAEDDCVVISKWHPPLPKVIRDELDAQIDAILGDHENSDTDETPPYPGYRFADDFHIPLSRLGDVIEALRKHDRKAGSPND